MEDRCSLSILSYNKLKKIIIIVLLFPFLIKAQDLSGTWKGFFEAAGNNIQYELYIHEGLDGLEGYAMTSIVIDGIENIGIKEIALKIKKDKLNLEDGELVFNNFSNPGKKVMLTAVLSYDNKSIAKNLEGTYRTRSLDLRDKSYYSGKIFLSKQKENAPSILIAKLTEMKLLPWQEKNLVALNEKNKLPKTTEVKVIVHKNKEAVSPALNNNNINSPAPSAPAALFMSRKTEIVSTYQFLGDSIEINFYDNGTIDGDTISVLLNQEIIISKKRLGLEPIHQIIRIPQGSDSLLLTMYAENLGIYPPNTGILIIQDGKSRNEIRFTGNLEKSAAVLLRRKK